MVMRKSNFRFQFGWIYSHRRTNLTTLIRNSNTQINRFKKLETCDFTNSTIILYLHAMSASYKCRLY